MNTSDFAQRLADKLVEQLKEGTAPWQQPWSEGQAFGPYNPTTGNRYRGVNILALLATKYTDPRWMTYKQAQSQGWQVRAGEKSTQIQHWIWEEEQVRLDKNGQPVLDDRGKLVKDAVRLQRLEHSQVGGAYYRLSTDTIHLPAGERFASAGDYYSTALHELGHWTGHADRLNRDMAHPFGTEAYAREELRAEIASLILGSELGIGYDPEQHAGYVDHWIQILTETPKEILYAAADAERISEYILTIEQRQEIHQRREATNVKRDIPEAERIYLAVPYNERQEAKALGARWDGAKKAWYVGPEVDRTKITKWELRHQPEPTLDPRAEFAAVLRSIGGIVEGDHPIMNGEPQRIRTHDDKPGDKAIFYVAHEDGVANGYAENNRTKEIVRWKARGQHLSQEARTELLAEAEKKRYARRQAEQEMYEATARRLAEDLRGLSSGVETTGYHKAKQIEAVVGAPVRNGDVLVPGYDMDGKLWTVQYIKEDGTKRFAKESRKHGCFHVIGAANGAAALQKISLSPVVVIAEGYATAATVAKHANVTAIAAFDSGNLLAVATALRERYKDKPIIVAGDDDYRLEKNPGREKAIEAAAAVKGLAVFPNLSAEQREQGFTDFNDLAREDAHLAKRQLEEAVWSVRQQVEQQTVEIGMPRLDSRAGREAGVGLATG